MAQYDVHPGDRIRYLSAVRPDKIRTGTLEQVGPTPDGSGLLYIIREDGDDPQVTTLTVIDSPRVLLMERESKTKTLD